MIVTPEPVNLMLPQPESPRSDGIHLSGIIRCMATEYGILKPEWAEELSLVDVRQINDPTTLLRISVGLAWESWYIPKILAEEGVMDHPGEMQVDGIYMTHDGESLDAIICTPAAHEIKATWKSTKTVGDLSSQWMWMVQLKGYCKGLHTTVAHMHVLFLNGDYSYPLAPVLKRWKVEFTQQEIDENWAMITEYRDYRLAQENK